MKRQIFFFLEKLKITPAERKAVAVLTLTLTLLATLNFTLEPSEPFQKEQYAEIEQRFRERTAQINAERAKKMKRYFPPERKEVALTVITDTVEADTIDKKSDTQENKSTDISEKARINVNKADREALKTLPGIGPAYSKRIIQYRQEQGSFKKIEELKKIKGIGEKRLEKLKPFVKLTDPQ